MSKLTELELCALTAEQDGQIVYDAGALRGQVRAKNGDIVVAFAYRYRFEGKVRDVRCGTWPRSTLKEIRAARNSASEMVRTGIDPGFAKKQARVQRLVTHREAVSTLQALTARPTLSQVFEDWHRREVSKRTDGGKEIRRAFEKDVLPKLGAIAAEDIGRRHLMAVLDEVKERGVKRYANVLLQYLRQLFRYAAVREIVRGDPTFGVVKKDVGGKEGIRERFLTEPEIRELQSKLPGAGLTLGAETGIWIMLSTCCRIGELSRARWSDLDWTARTWTIPKEHSKNGRQHVIHLSDFTIRHFETLLEAQDEGQTSVFPSRDGSGHREVKSLQKQFYDRQRDVPMKGRTQLVGTLKLQGGGWTAHDLRRTGATLMGELGVRSDVIERCLNHVGEDKLRKIYQRQELIAERVEAFRRLGERLELLTSPRGNVVAGDFRLKVLEAVVAA